MKSGMQFDSVNVYNAAVLQESKVPISFAKDEIAFLHQLHIGIEVTGATTSARVYFSLKSAKGNGVAPPEAEGDLISDKHTFLRIAWNIAVGLERTYEDTIYFDPPIILIREPRVIVTTGSVTGYVNAFFYYTKEKVSSADLTRFMVKKHH
jgi:hypothetical protein